MNYVNYVRESFVPGQNGFVNSVQCSTAMNALRSSTHVEALSASIGSESHIKVNLKTNQLFAVTTTLKWPVYSVISVSC